MSSTKPYLESNLKKSTEDFLNLFFNPGEEICFSANEYAYPSDTQDKLNEDVTVLVAINPITGKRRDENVTSYRTFMIECDDMSIPEQWEYVNKIGFPYSYCCYSGGKSLHFAIVLDHEIPSENMYRHTYQWILNIMTEADQKTKNPSRCIRFPGVIRPGKKEQKLMHMGERIPLEKLSKWLNKHQDKRPEPLVRKARNYGTPNIEGVKSWARKALIEGVHNMEGSRNQMWMSLGCELALNGYNLSDTIEYLGNFFEEQSDFRQREWLTAVKSGWGYADKVSK